MQERCFGYVVAIRHVDTGELVVGKLPFYGAKIDDLRNAVLACRPLYAYGVERRPALYLTQLASDADLQAFLKLTQRNEIVFAATFADAVDVASRSSAPP